MSANKDVQNMAFTDAAQGTQVHKLIGDIAAGGAGPIFLWLNLPNILTVLVCLCALTWWGFRFYEKFTGKTIGKKPAN